VASLAAYVIQEACGGGALKKDGSKSDDDDDSMEQRDADAGANKSTKAVLQHGCTILKCLHELDADACK
jgi:hypothetical protein